MKLTSFFSRGVVAAGLVSAGIGMLLAPAAAQFFDERFPFERRGGSIFGPPPGLFPPPPQQQAPRPADYSRAPAPKKYEKNEGADLSTVVIMGDSMADYLAYGLEQALADSPEIAVVRKPRTFSSLIYNQTAVRNRNTDWPAAAREILSKENANFVVMMIGLGDRESIREYRPPPPAPAKPGTSGAASAKPGETKPGEVRPGESKAADAKASDQASAPARPDAAKPGDTSPQQEGANAHSDDEAHDEPAAAASEGARGVTLTHEFKSEKWVELYSKRVDETIAALKSEGVPVIWVGLPPVRGTRSMSEMAFLNDIYRSRVEKAGGIYVDVWDGFVDENNRFALHGPDFEGQRRRLRTADGVHFTSYGARKLAHYLEKEIRRAMTPTGPVAIPLPVDPAADQPVIAAPGSSAAPRPLAGPVIPLNGNSEPLDGDELAGATGARQSLADAVASRVLIRGEAMPIPAGRADDYVWPRRVPMPIGADPAVATTTLPMTPMIAERPKPPPAAAVAQAAPAKPRAPRPPGQATAQSHAQALAAQREAQFRRAQQQSPFFFFFAR